MNAGRNEAADRVGVWTALLDDLEAVLDAQTQCLEATAAGAVPIDIPRFDTPRTVPPIPMSLRSRAVALAERTALLISETSEAADHVRPANPAARTRTTSSAGAASTFDELG